MLNYEHFDAILFDMDGTIFDSEAVHRDAWIMTAEQFGQIFTAEMYLQFIGMTTPDCMKLAMEMFHNQVELETFSQRYYQNLETLLENPVPLKTGFSKYLQRLKSIGLPLGIVTSSANAGVEANFRHYSFYGDFTVVVTRDDVSNFKPSPEPYLLACDKLNVAPHRTIVFEDSNTGATAGIDAGCYTIGIPDLVPFTQQVSQRLARELSSFEEL